MGVGGWKGARQPGMEDGGARWDSGDGPRECLGPAQPGRGRGWARERRAKLGMAAVVGTTYTVAVRYSRLPMGGK